MGYPRLRAPGSTVLSLSCERFPEPKLSRELRDRTKRFAGRVLEAAIEADPTITSVNGLRTGWLENKLRRAKELASRPSEGCIRNHPILSATGHCHRRKVGDSKGTTARWQVGHRHRTRQQRSRRATCIFIDACLREQVEIA